MGRIGFRYRGFEPGPSRGGGVLITFYAVEGGFCGGEDEGWGVVAADIRELEVFGVMICVGLAYKNPWPMLTI